MRWPSARPARPATPAWNVAKTLLQAALFWGTFLGAIPWALSSAEARLGLPCWTRIGGAADGPERNAIRIGAAALFAVASVLGLSSGITMAVRGRGTPLPLDAPRELVVAGPYRRVRNPMAIAGLSQGVAVGLYLGSPLVLAYVAAGLLLWQAFVRRWEEADLEERFGNAYRLYRRRVRCWRPRLRAYDPAREGQEPQVAAEKTSPPGRHVLLYDGDCPLCRRQVGNILTLARRGAVEAVSIHDPAVPSRFPGLAPQALRRQMHLVLPDGRVLGGFEAAVRAVATRPFPGWIAYAYYLPGLRLLLDLAYALLALNRYRIGGIDPAACDDGRCGAHGAGDKVKPP